MSKFELNSFYDLAKERQDEIVENELEKIRRNELRKRRGLKPIYERRELTKKQAYVQDEFFKRFFNSFIDNETRTKFDMDNEMSKIEAEYDRMQNKEFVRKGIEKLVLPEGTALSSHNRRIYSEDTYQIINDYCRNCTKTENCMTYFEFEHPEGSGIGRPYENKTLLPVEYKQKGKQIKKFYCVKYYKKE